MSRRYAGALALATLFAVVTALLGVWQWGRHTDRVAVIERIETNYDTEARALDEVLPGSQPLGSDAEWVRVETRGTYDPDPLLVRNRPLNSVYGYHVLSVLRPDAGGAALLVDRGWVPNAATAATLPDVPPTPQGELVVTGWLRPSEPSLGRSLPEGQLASIQLAEAEQATGADLRGGYLVLEQETTPSGAEPTRPAPLEPPGVDPGPHQAYAIQWWLAVPVGFVLVVVKARRDLLDEQEDEALQGAGDGPGEPGGSREPATAGTPRSRSARPKKVRIWDEEDE